MVQSGHEKLSVVRQCSLLGIARSGLYYTPKGESALTLSLMQEIDRAFTEWPFLGVRQMRNYLVLLGYGAGNDVTAAGVFADLLRTLSWKLGV